MARITVEDCLKKVDNRFALIHLAAKRVRYLRKGAEPLVICKNKDIVVSLREIAAGKVIQYREEEGGKIEGPVQAQLPEGSQEESEEAAPDEAKETQASESEG